MISRLRVRINQTHLLPVLFWIAVWQVIAIVVDKEMLLASPFAVIGTLCDLITTKSFWVSIFSSFYKIAFGFLLGVLLGIGLAVLSYKSAMIKELTTPLMKVVKSTPVASFIILSLIWISSNNLSILISFLMVVPVIYTNVLEGFYHVDSKLLEMAKVYQVSWIKKIRYIIIPSIMPYFVSACSIGLGFCWKSGIAAEVIGLPQNSIGERLYEAKLYLMTKELFAWTIIIVLVSVVFEKIVMKALRRIEGIFY